MDFKNKLLFILGISLVSNFTIKGYFGELVVQDCKAVVKDKELLTSEKTLLISSIVIPLISLGYSAYVTTKACYQITSPGEAIMAFGVLPLISKVLFIGQEALEEHYGKVFIRF